MPQPGSLAVAVLLAAAVVVAATDRRRSGRRWRTQDPHRPGKSAGRVKGGGHPAGPDLGLRDPALMLELIGAMLDTGAGLGRSLDLIAGHASEEIRRPLVPVVSALAIGADWETAWRGSGPVPAPVLALKEALDFAAKTGVPSAAILYAQAARLRREQFRDAERHAAALGVKLVIPLGLCSLPAFVCLGIVPVLLALLPPGT
nr:type II secretion system F family protein [Arthrobacter sp. UKPF54-2]